MVTSPGRRLGFLNRVLGWVVRVPAGGSGAPRNAFPRARVRRGVVGGVPFFVVTMELPGASYPAWARALAGSVAEVCTGHRGTVGSVTVVPGEEPALVTLATHRDTVAQRLLGVLLAGESHRFPHLVLLLAPGVYLGEVVDPFAPFDASLEVVARLLDPGRVSLAGRLAVQPTRGGSVVEVEVALLGLERQALRRAVVAGRAAAASRLV